METLGVIALMVNILLFPKFWRKKMLPDTEREKQKVWLVVVRIIKRKPRIRPLNGTVRP